MKPRTVGYFCAEKEQKGVLKLRFFERLTELTSIYTAQQASLTATTSIIGIIVTYAFGGWSELLSFFLLAIVVDYVTGISASVKEKTGLNSEVGFWGLAKKGFMLLVILLAHRMDMLLTTDFIMTGAIYFYLANELLSITENYGRLGLPLPNSVRKAIEVLKGKVEEPAQFERKDAS